MDGVVGECCGLYPETGNPQLLLYYPNLVSVRIARLIRGVQKVLCGAEVGGNVAEITPS